MDAQHFGNLFRRALAFVALADVHVNATATGIHRGVGCHGLGNEPCQLRRLLHLEPGVFEAGAGGCANVDGDHSTIGSGQKARTPDGFLQQHGQAQENDGDDRHRLAVMQRPGDDVAVAVRQRIEPVVEFPQPLPDAVLLTMSPVHRVTPVRGEHWIERERDEKTDQHRGCHGDGERAEPLTGDPAHEGNRYEHRHDRQRGRSHGHTDLGCAIAGGSDPVFTALHMAHDVLAHHDRIVDQHSDGQGQAEQRHEIEREAASPHCNERRHGGRRQ